YSYRLDLTTIRGTRGRMTAATALKAAQYREKKAWFLGPRFATNADVAPTVGTWPYGLQRGLTFISTPIASFRDWKYLSDICQPSSQVTEASISNVRYSRILSRRNWTWK